MTNVETLQRLPRIGNTPVERIWLVVAGVPRPVHLKLEGANPFGSLKDRTAASLVQALERAGRLERDSILVESTSGNLGVSLASIARAKRIPFVAVVDPKTTGEKLAAMAALGAEIELVTEPDTTGGYLLSRLARVRKLCRSSSRFLWTDQYSNAANPTAHEHGTAPEIHRQLRSSVGAVFVAVSTGGTLAGVGRYFRAHSPATEIVAVDAVGSVVFGGWAGPRALTGIGSSRPSRFLTPGLYDAVVHVRDDEAFAFCHALRSATGLSVGGSSGAVLAAAARYLAERPTSDPVVCVCPDGGEAYESSIFSSAWLEEHGIDVSAAKLGLVDEILPP